MTESSRKVPQSAECLILKCPVCNSDVAETLGVTGRQVGDGEREHVVLLCLACGTAYLEPPADEGSRRGPASASKKDLLHRGNASHPSAESLRDVLSSPTNDAPRQVIYSPNVDSSAFHAFGGRHWIFYEPSQYSEYYGFNGISRLVESSGARLARYETIYAPSVWTQSLQCRMRDWGVHWSIKFLLTGPWLVPQAVAGLLEVIAQFRGRGAMMRFEVEKS